MTEEEVIHRHRDIVHSVYLCVYMRAMLEHAVTVSFSWIQLYLALESKSLRNIPIIEMLSILQQSPKQSVPDESSLMNPWEINQGPILSSGLWIDKWPPAGREELTVAVVYFTGLETA